MTRALLLAGAALAGAPGCVTVSAPEPPKPPAGNAPGAAVPDGHVSAAPSASAREAITTPQTRPPAPALTRAASPPPARSARPAPAPPGHPAEAVPEPTASAPPPRRTPTAPSMGQVCDLGEAYGGWGPDSSTLELCRDTYG
ncbi:hypothetical protein JJV70_14525 [Streptomyces sp. JJ66]|uniref:hypothetical protein n=1 Tax=Streptomyces sp. JJ66 TaxID=2803843 RepID=UPI001C56E168|nr:hypothetical protein [Streptomyces sp. JJ66]MBW1603293.1 hypothetical protein [Streptomyces sp. JJ66]